MPQINYKLQGFDGFIDAFVAIRRKQFVEMDLQASQYRLGDSTGPP